MEKIHRPTKKVGHQFIHNCRPGEPQVRTSRVELISALHMSANRSAEEGFHGVAERLRADAEYLSELLDNNSVITIIVES